MILALLVSLICLEVPASAPLSISVIKHWYDGSISSNNGGCNLCPCWKASPGGLGCSLVAGCAAGCGYTDIVGCPDCIQWRKLPDAFGCIDMDSLPIPQDGWIYFVKGVP